MQAREIIDRMRQIGSEIAALSNEAKTLRAKMASVALDYGLPVPKDENGEAVRFICGNTVVTVKTVKGDFTILLDDLPEL